MTKQLHKNIFSEAATLTLEDVRRQVDTHYSGTARRDRLSALDTLARVKDLKLSTIRAHPRIVRELLQDKCAAELGLSDARWKNVRSAVVSCVREFGESVTAIKKQLPINAEWSRLFAKVNDLRLREGMYRFARFCSALSIKPEEVSRDTLLAFYDALVEEDLLGSPIRKLRQTMNRWNVCHRTIDDWPPFRLASPFEQDHVRLPASAFTEALHTDVARWRSRLEDPDPLDPKSLVRPLRPATIADKESIAYRFASALIRSGHKEAGDINGLADLVSDLDSFKAGLRIFLDRAKDGCTANTARIADCMRGIAKHYIEVDSALLDEMEAICKRLRKDKRRGLTQKNRDRLAQFDDPKNTAKLMAFPAEEAARGRQHPNPMRAAKCIERAAIISLILATGLRITSLRTIHMSTDLTRSDGRTYLGIPADRVKNGIDLNFELPQQTADLIDEYRTIYRPRLAGSESDFLFAGTKGGPRSAGALSTAIQSALKKHCGLTMNPHLFRHTMAKIVIEHDPALAMMVSRHLGHKSFDTTMAHYLGTEGRVAARTIDTILQQAKDDAHD